jgi:hypothetical protein
MQWNTDRSRCAGGQWGAPPGTRSRYVFLPSKWPMWSEPFKPVIFALFCSHVICTPKVVGVHFKLYAVYNRTRGSLVVMALCYRPEGRGLETRWGEWISLIHLILPAALDPGVYSVSNRNEYKKQKNNVRPVPTTLPLSVNRLTTQCGILNLSQPYRPPRPVTEIALHSS